MRKYEPKFCVKSKIVWEWNLWKNFYFKGVKIILKQKKKKKKCKSNHILEGVIFYTPHVRQSNSHTHKLVRCNAYTIPNTPIVFSIYRPIDERNKKNQLHNKTKNVVSLLFSDIDNWNSPGFSFGQFYTPFSSLTRHHTRRIGTVQLTSTLRKTRRVHQFVPILSTTHHIRAHLSSLYGEGPEIGSLPQSISNQKFTKTSWDVILLSLFQKYHKNMQKYMKPSHARIPLRNYGVTRNWLPNS